MLVFDLNPMVELRFCLKKWRVDNKKYLAEMPQAISLTYKEFSYIWTLVQMHEHDLMHESEVHVPLKKDIEANRERYRLFSMLVYIED